MYPDRKIHLYFGFKIFVEKIKVNLDICKMINFVILMSGAESLPLEGEEESVTTKLSVL